MTKNEALNILEGVLIVTNCALCPFKDECIGKRFKCIEAIERLYDNDVPTSVLIAVGAVFYGAGILIGLFLGKGV